MVKAPKTAVRSAALEAASSSPGSSGWTDSGPASFRECRATPRRRRGRAATGRPRGHLGCHGLFRAQSFPDPRVPAARVRATDWAPWADVGQALTMLARSKSKSLALASIRAGVVDRASTAQPRCREWRSETWAALRPAASAMRCTAGSESRPGCRRVNRLDICVQLYMCYVEDTAGADQDMPANRPRLAEAGGHPVLDLALPGHGRIGRRLWAALVRLLALLRRRRSQRT
jgi:hypothetical protein